MEITTLSCDVDYSFKKPSEILIIKGWVSYIFSIVFYFIQVAAFNLHFTACYRMFI